MIFAITTIALGQPMMNMTDLISEIDARRLRAVVEKLSSFHTRNTLSPGMTESAEWVAKELRLNPALEVELMKYRLPKGRRVPEEKDVVQVVATLPGATDRIVLIGAHLDSLNLSVDAETGRAPGANDDASGVAVCMELARIMAKRKWNQTLKFVAFSGEEQGLLGSRTLAARASQEKWKLEAVLSNDTVGSSSNKIGQRDEKRVRVFSDESDTHNGRELARFIEWTVRNELSNFGVKLVFRRDRFGRGGDHTPFADAGFPAVRFIEVYEEYTRQHTPDDLSEHMDWNYLANVAKANLVSMAALAQADDPPTNVRIDQRQGHNTTLSWTAKTNSKYVVYWRETTHAVWHKAIPVGTVSSYTVEGINKDDHVFAVGAEGGIPVLAR